MSKGKKTNFDKIDGGEIISVKVRNQTKKARR